MRDEPMSDVEMKAYGQEVAFENHQAAEGERRHYRERELDMFFEWEENILPFVTRHDPSYAYESFHERRLGLGLTEDSIIGERFLYRDRKEQREYQLGRAADDDIFF